MTENRMKSQYITKNLLIIAALSIITLSAVFEIYNLDIGFHIKTGEYIVQHGAIPTKDPFSYTLPQNPWPIHQWLPGVIFYFVYQAFDIPGLIIFKALVVCLIFFTMYKTAYLKSGDYYIAIWVILLAAFVGRARFYVRPFIFSSLFLAISLYLLEKYSVSNKRKYLVIFVGLMVFWANIHAGWIYGVILIAIFSGGELIKYMFNVLTGKVQPIHTKVKILNLLNVLVGCIVLSFVAVYLVNPNGIKVLLLPFQFFSSKYFMTVIEEFKPIYLFRAPLYWIMVSLISINLLFSFKKLEVTDFLIFISFLYLSISASRLVLNFAILTVPLLAKYLKLNLSVCKNYLEEKELKFTIRFGKYLITGLLVLGVVLFGYKSVFENGGPKFGLNKKTYPLGAYKFIEKNNIKGEVFNEDGWGGSFMWAFYPKRRVFIDNRLPVYGEDFFKNVYAEIMYGGSNWKELLEKYKVNYLLVNYSKEKGEIQDLAFADPDWILVYWDDISMIYVKNNLQNKELIDEFGYYLTNPSNFLDVFSKDFNIEDLIDESIRAVRITPNSYKAHNYLGICLGKLGQYEEAVKEFRIALRIKPYLSSVYSNLGMCYKKMGLWDEAEKEFRAVLNLDSKLINAYNNLIYIYEQTEDWRKGISVCKKMLKINSEDADIYCKLGMFYEKTGQREKAIEIWENGVKINPDSECLKNALETQ